MVRNIDSLGRIVISIEIRHRLNMDSGTPCEIYDNGSEVILSKNNSDERVVAGLG